MTRHVHTYGCISRDAEGNMSFACGHPIGAEARAILQAYNDDNEEEFDRLVKVIGGRACV